MGKTPAEARQHQQREMEHQAPVAMVGELGAIKDILMAIEVHLGSIADSAHKIAHPLVILSTDRLGNN